MKIPAGATSYTPKASPLLAGSFHGTAMRRTFRPRGSFDWLLIYTTGGSGLYRSDGRHLRSRAHDVMLYRPGVFQDYEIAPEAGTWDLLYAHFLPRAEWTHWLDWPELAPGFMGLHLADATLRRRVLARWRDLIRLNASSRPHGRELALNALEEVLLWCDTLNPRRSSPQPDPRVSKAMDYLTSHLAEPFSEDKLARAAGLSPSRLRHLYRLQAGDSPRHFLEQQRLRRARDLLALSRRTIAEIALETGFQNPFYFTLRFKKAIGESPRDYRKRITRGP